MRGKESPLVGGVLHFRITPAYAGKSFHFFGSRCGCRDHPRLCGEKLWNMRSFDHETGSPPPMRGKVRYNCISRSGFGITPAYAGKRFRGKSKFYSFWDHPRLCGEKSVTDLDGNPITGSPPPMRGKVYDICRIYGGAGITPAYAGKRFSCCVGTSLRRDHPRLCGEKVAASQKQACESGSPPPMRGKA